MKTNKEKFLQNVMNSFQEGDTLKWIDNSIIHYGCCMNVLSEYNTITDRIDIY